MGYVMDNKYYVDTLKHIAGLPTVYKNKYPYNLGYYDGKKWSYDCWNLIKTVINRVGIEGKWRDSNVGEYQKNLSITGDVTGSTLLSKCTVKSTDFKKLSYPGTYLFIKNSHAGTYIGETVINGKYYNVIECTASWTKNVLYSWVDSDGTRRQYKGARANSKWTNWGLLPWIDYKYGADPTPSPAPTPTPTPTPTPKPSDDESKIILGKYYYTSPSDKKKVDMGYAFNPTYYANHWPDVVKVYGTNDKKLFQHFTTYGMKEHRQAITSFDPVKYRKNYPDLDKTYGDNWPAYYEHYCRYGYKEGRKGI